jgi:Thiol:disulfide interchange protein DsbD, N-terminal
LSDRFRGIPYPGTFMVDRRGRVTSRFFEDSFRERNTVSNLLQKLGAGGAQVQGSQISTNHLQMKTYPSDSGVALGNRFSLVLEITPGPEMHVYAPGAVNYRVITLAIDPQAFVRVLPLQYPASEIYVFKPLKERVPVYRKPFTLLQEIVPEVTPEAQAAFRGQEALTLTGSLEYQACDETICYNPVSIPLSWTLALKPLEAPTPAAAPTAVPGR